MLTQAIALLTVCVPPCPQAPTAAELIMKMFVRYDAAKTLVGTIHYTVSAKSVSGGTGTSASLDTSLQYERPSKLYLSQQKVSGNPDPGQPTKWLVTSDGINFSYNVPNDRFEAAPGVRLAEAVENKRMKITQTVGSIYNAASKSLGDRSMPLDVAIAFKGDLNYRKGQWITKDVSGPRDFNGKSAYVISGDYQPYLGAGKAGTYAMAITAEGDLLSYEERMRVSAGNQGEVDIVNSWIVDLQVNATVNAALFKVILR